MERALNDGVIQPILGIAFLPWTTAHYTAGCVIEEATAPWGLAGSMIGLFLEMALHAGSVTITRRRSSG